MRRAAARRILIETLTIKKNKQLGIPEYRCVDCDQRFDKSAMGWMSAVDTRRHGRCLTCEDIVRVKHNLKNAALRAVRQAEREAVNERKRIMRAKARAARNKREQQAIKPLQTDNEKLERERLKAIREDEAANGAKRKVVIEAFNHQSANPEPIEEKEKKWVSDFVRLQAIKARPIL